MINFLFSILLAFPLYSQVESQLFYKDIDYFTLRGTIPLLESEKNQYPYYQIKNVGSDQRILTLCYTKDKKTVCTYKRVKDYWVRVTKLDEEDEMYSYEYIFPNRTLTLVYEGNPNSKDFQLLSVKIFTLKKVTEANYSKFNLKLSPSPTVEGILKGYKPTNTYQTYITLANGEVKTVSELKEGNVIVKTKKKCYTIKKGNYIHNIFWWNFFQGEEHNCQQ
ncbi:hypothetical protein [Xanthocytophaga agilis]|uniref:Uncharacterized protein n=1 Tax=Xanthocytophaga agilis TaxID=3048010 RepID=A0AAE3UEC3_9BACT|nr:hypothetical protein [Xanthocytophaga agilis]MDJ1502080.1 hypothetical protein [Xanthocytophaga agilis]